MKFNRNLGIPIREFRRKSYRYSVYEFSHIAVVSSKRARIGLLNLGIAGEISEYFALETQKYWDRIYEL